MRYTASSSSPLMEQQMQPLLSSTMSSPVAMIRSLSMPISPNSFTRTAVFTPCWLLRMWFSRVVLPAPRKPVRIVTGRPVAVGSGWITALGSEVVTLAITRWRARERWIRV